MAVQIQVRRGTAASWTSTNPTLGAGEIGFETDTNLFKIGTGAAAWTSLSYANPATTATNIVANATTTTLTAASSMYQVVTGSTTHTIVLPVTSTLTVGRQFQIVNTSTGNVTVNSSGGNLVYLLGKDQAGFFTCKLTSGTTAASWSGEFMGDSPEPDLSNFLLMGG